LARVHAVIMAHAWALRRYQQARSCLLTLPTEHHLQLSFPSYSMQPPLSPSPPGTRPATCRCVEHPSKSQWLRWQQQEWVGGTHSCGLCIPCSHALLRLCSRAPSYHGCTQVAVVVLHRTGSRTHTTRQDLTLPTTSARQYESCRAHTLGVGTQTQSLSHMLCEELLHPCRGTRDLEAVDVCPCCYAQTRPIYEHKPSTPAQNKHLTQVQDCRGTAKNSSGCLAQCVAVGQFEPGSTSCQAVYGLQAAG
jgi:hypothetical protein